MSTNIRDIGSRKWWAVGAISLAAIAFSLDLTVLNLALPTLSKALHASTSQLQWIADAYALALAVLTLPAGMLGDRFGRKRLLVMAIALFGIASAACAYSTSVNMLISARILLGVGAAFILPLGMSVMPLYFRPAERTKALAILMGGVFLAYPLGPILGGWLLTHFWWGSVFLINIPVCLLALVAIVALLPESKSAVARSIDWLGIILSSAGLTGITYGAIQAESSGWSDGKIVTALVVGFILLGAFVAWERYTLASKKDSLIDLKLFSYGAFTWGTILMTSVNFALFGLLFGLPQYLQAVRGDDALNAGYFLLPMIGGLIIGSVVAGRVAAAAPHKVMVTLGFVCMAVGLLLGATTTLDSTAQFIVAWTAVIGLGLGIAMPTVATAAISPLSADRSASGTALISAVRQVGGTLGIALLGTLMGSSYRNHLNISYLPHSLQTSVSQSVIAGVTIAKTLHIPGLLGTVQSAFVMGLTDMLRVCGGIALAAAVVALVFLPNAHKVKTAPGSARVRTETD
jgi:DHA2 family multidrug resistance protein-like MFS transporter